MRSHARLLAVSVRHPYCGEASCGDYVLVPTGDTEKWLTDHRCTSKARPGGVEVYVALDAQGKPQIAFADSPRLSFELRLQTPELAFFTAPDSVPAQPGLALSHPDGRADRLPARLDIDPNLNRLGDAEITLSYAVKPYYWVYFLIVDAGVAVSDFTIAKTGSDPLTWQPLQAAEPISAKLAGLYPGTTIVRLVSAARIYGRASGIPHIRLSYAGNVIIESLPNPSWRNYFHLETEADGGNIEAIFHIVKVLTNTTLTKV